MGQEGLEEFTQAKIINMEKQQLRPCRQQSCTSIDNCRSQPGRCYSRRFWCIFSGLATGRAAGSWKREWLRSTSAAMKAATSLTCVARL
jgi:hypothetical protein